MKEEFNIAAILKDKPQGTKLYDLLYNVDVELDTISTTDTETVVWCTNETNNNTTCHRGYSEFGTIRGCPDGLQILLPSKEMRDWRKFSWKKGDILAKDSTCVCVFNEWNNDKYTSIKCKYIKYMDAGSYAEDKVYITDDLHLASQEEKDAYISSIEEHYGGKLNLETLEIEHPKPEFKDGDIVVAEGDNLEKKIFIFRYKMRDSYSDERIYRSHISINSDGTLFHKLMFYLREDVTYRLATDSEKQQLFDAIAKENKRWNPENKTIEDLPKKCELEPFQKVLVRDRYTDEWMAGFFSHYIESSKDFVCTSGSWRQCIPYNDKTKHLLGTTDDWKGGEA